VKKIIIAVGGAGQMVLHHFIQLYLLGQCESVFDAYVLDTDSAANSILALSDLFDQARCAVDAADASGIPAIRFIQIKPETDEGNVDQLLMQQPLPGQSGYHHPAQAFFDRDSLRMSVRQGMYARPSLSAVVSFADAIQELGAHQFPIDASVVVTGSCIGGTGGGLLIPLIWHLAHADNKDFKITPVLLGDFFGAGQSRGVVANTGSGDSELFRSNRLAFLNCLAEAVPHLSQFAFIEEQRMQSRDWVQEKAAQHLNWANANEPYWKAAAACEHFFRESVAAPAQKFTQRELPEEAYARKFNRDSAMSRLGARLGRVNAFLDRHALQHIASDGPVRRVWGDAVVNYLISAWQLLVHEQHQPPDAFLKAVQNHAVQRWKRSGVASYALSQVFPAIPKVDASVAELASTDWPRPLVSRDVAAVSLKEAANSVSAALIYSIIATQR
jgi:hypothetical protein